MIFLILIVAFAGRGLYVFMNSTGASGETTAVSLLLASAETVTVIVFLSASVFAYVHPAGAGVFFSAIVNVYVPALKNVMSPNATLSSPPSAIFAAVETVAEEGITIKPSVMAFSVASSPALISNSNASFALAPETFFVTCGATTAGIYSLVYVIVKFALPWSISPLIFVSSLTGAAEPLVISFS